MPVFMQQRSFHSVTFLPSFLPSFLPPSLPPFLPLSHSLIHVLISCHLPGTGLGTLQALCYLFLTSLHCRDCYCSYFADEKIEDEKNYRGFLK